MGNGTMQENVILLFDSYQPDSKSLHQSFKMAGCDFPALVIDDDGFLPEDVQSIYGYFLGDYRSAPNSFGRPRYFNEIPIPDFWEISASNLAGKISDSCYERGRIFFAFPTHRRHVRQVEWKDEKGVVRYVDHYNQFGAVYARTSCDAKGKRIVKSYFSPSGREVIVENFVTQDILLNMGDTVRIFNNKTEFIAYFLRLTGHDQDRIFFNSLSTPFFVSCYLPGESKKDVLFWQEPVADAIPGNMQMILRGEARRTARIYVQKRMAYDRLMQLKADPQIVKLKGFLYPFRRENRHRPTALICTNSDQIEHCEQIVSALPQIQFHIAALTEMSSKLLAMGKYENVHLYPGVKTDMAGRLFRQSDIYLDINHGNEILSAVNRAFLHNQVILGFSNTLHDGNFLPKEHIYAPEQAEQMIRDIAAMVENPQDWDARVQRQRQQALAEDPQSFLQF